MHIEEKVAMRILAGARRWLNRHGMHERSAFSPEEAGRRVAFYAGQVASGGQISQWLAPPDDRGMKRRRMPVKLRAWRWQAEWRA